MTKWISLLIFCTTSVCADLDHAITLYRAGEYHQAQEALSKLDQETLKPWQNSIVTYNLATTLLAQNKLEQAMALYNIISLAFSPDQYPVPLLKAHLATNHAIARLRQAIAVQDIDLFRDTLERIAQAQTASCQLEKFEGRTLCQERVDLKQMEQTAKLNLAALLMIKQQQLLEDPSREEGIFLLIQYLQQAQDNARFLKQKSLNDKLQKRYRHYFATKEKEWLFLWDALLVKMQDEPVTHTLLTQAKDSYERDDFTAALSYLEKLTPKKNSLRFLANRYETILFHGILNQTTLANLLEQQQLPQADAQLKKALESLKKGQQNSARLHVLAAEQEIKRALQETETPLQTLNAAIEAQKYAVKVNRLTQLLEIDEQNEATSLVSQAQKQVLDQATPFLQQVYLFQEQYFPYACQKHPWDAALPLFIKGLDTANESQDHLVTTPPSLSHIQALQEKTLHDWQTAYDTIINYQPREAPEQEEETPLNEILQHLQEMDQQDRTRLPVIPLTPTGEERPW